MKKALLASTGLLTGAVLMLASPAWSQNRNCEPREAVAERLADRYGETRQSVGLGANGAMVETWASAESGSWTITVTMPTGITCLVASGQNFERINEDLPNTDDDA